MSHSIIIIGDKLDCLKAQGENFLASIESLRAAAVEADDYLNQHPTLDRAASEGIHHELEETESLASSMCLANATSELTDALAIQRNDVEAAIPE